MSKKVSISLIVAGLLIFASLFFLYFFQKYHQVVVKVNQPAGITPTATPTPDPLRPISILLLGYGGGQHQGGYLTDTIIVAKIDPRLKIISLISIPRDLWVPIPVSSNEEKFSKINSAYTIGIDDKKYPQKNVQFTGLAGGGAMSKSVVNKVLGFNIDYFVALDFQGFVKTVDILGGISVPVKTTFDDPYYPLETNIDDTCGKSEDEIKSIEATMSGDKLDQQFICRYEHLHFEKGIQTMDGITALKFVRSRHSTTDGGDFNRANRQQLVISAIKSKILRLNFIPKIIPFINTLASNMRTDIDFSKMQELLDKSSEFSQYQIKSIALTDQNVLSQSRSSDGQFILIPKIGDNQWTDIQSFVSTQSATTGF